MKFVDCIENWVRWINIFESLLCFGESDRLTRLVLHKLAVLRIPIVLLLLSDVSRERH